MGLLSALKQETADVRCTLHMQQQPPQFIVTQKKLGFGLYRDICARAPCGLLEKKKGDKKKVKEDNIN